MGRRRGIFSDFLITFFVNFLLYFLSVNFLCKIHVKNDEILTLFYVIFVYATENFKESMRQYLRKWEKALF